MVPALALALGFGCLTPFDVPAGLLIDPPPEYRIWWDQVERCVGTRRDFYEVEWFAGEPTTDTGDELTGAWTAPRFIVLRPFYLTSEPAVKHEMLHHLTRGEMPHSHPAFRTCTRTGGRKVHIIVGS